MAEDKEEPVKPFAPPIPPLASAAPQAPTPPAPPAFPDRQDYEKKLSEMERRLQEEREKLLRANLKTQEEAAASARVEVSIKDLQDRLRRERRDQEQEEARRKLEGRLQEMEVRLAQERETWVATLKGQMQSRETQDKEIESHFVLRLQEMERRSLEEKAQWQKLVLAKDEEIRNLRSLAERLKGADSELSKALSEKKWLEGRVAELGQERAESLVKVQAAVEREKEAIVLRADLAAARQQAAMTQERLEREVASLRQSSREREERLLSDHERLQRELESVGQRLRAEHESELRRIKLEAEADAQRTRDSLERASADLQKLRGVAGALERQAAASRVQIAELQSAKAEWEKVQERFKAEFVVLQRKWVDREKEIRAEAAAQAGQMLDIERSKMKLMAEGEVNQRAAKIADQMQREKEEELKRREAALRADLERELSVRLHKLQGDWDSARKEMEVELDRLHKEIFRKDAEWTERLLAKEAEARTLATKLDETASRLSREEEARQALAREKLALESSLLAGREEIGGLQANLAELKENFARADKERRELARVREDLERLSAAQAAQVRNAQETLEQMRGQLAREKHLISLYLKEKGELSARPRGEQPPGPSQPPVPRNEEGGSAAPGALPHTPAP